jgi:hypothetical protein
MSTTIDRIAELAKEDPKRQFFSIAHLITVEKLHEVFRSLRKDASAGIDGVTYEQYEANVEENIRQLHQRLKEGRYRAQPLRRVYIPKEVAAKLVDVLVSESPTRGTCPVAPVVISGGGAGDQSVGSPEVKVLVGWVERPGQLRQGGQASRQVVTMENRSEAPKSNIPTMESERGMWKVPSPSSLVRRPVSSVKELGGCNRWTFRGLRGRHVDKEQSTKARNHSLVA